MNLNESTISEINWKLQTYNITNYILSLDCSILSKNEVNKAIIKTNDLSHFLSQFGELSLWVYLTFYLIYAEHDFMTRKKIKSIFAKANMHLFPFPQKRPCMLGF